MSAPTRFLSTPYGGYLSRGVPEEDAELTHVGPGTPGGEYLRRFWHPVAMSSELQDLPVAVRIMGEDLVVFRDRGARVGLLARHCSHRGTSLEFGIVSDRGIRCCYHGWRFDVDGRILETPGEPADSTLKDRLCHPAYPALEYQGLVFAYLGPPGEKPALPVYDTFDLPGQTLVPYSIGYPCNWVQTAENSMDPAHVVFLHTRVSFAHFSAEWGVMPEIEFEETPLGMLYVTTRRMGDNVWVRSNDAILPNMTLVGATWVDGTEESVFTRVSATRWRVPLDDTHTMMIGWRHFDPRMDPEGKGRAGDIGKEKMDAFGQTGGRPYPEQQRVPGDYEAQVSQGPIAIHAREHLGHTDRGVAMFRRLLRRAIRRVAESGTVEPPAESGGRIPTYCHDTIVRLPVDPRSDDRARLRDVGQKVTAIVKESAGCAPGEREAFVARRVRELQGSGR
jgi:phenylpropionate dioxygenase-like ring-hydroxylating dioxygenase large terminal subunit